MGNSAKSYCEIIIYVVSSPISQVVLSPVCRIDWRDILHMTDFPFSRLKSTFRQQLVFSNCSTQIFLIFLWFYVFEWKCSAIQWHCILPCLVDWEFVTFIYIRGTFPYYVFPTIWYDINSDILLAMAHLILQHIHRHSHRYFIFRLIFSCILNLLSRAKSFLNACNVSEAT